LEVDTGLGNFGCGLAAVICPLIASKAEMIGCVANTDEGDFLSMLQCTQIHKISSLLLKPVWQARDELEICGK